MKRIYVLILIALIFSPFVSFAAEIRSGGNISVSGEAPIEQNAYIGSAKVVVDQEIKGDLSLAAMDAEVKSTITGDVIITGGTVHFSGVGKDDVKIAGSTVIFSGKAEKDLILLGGTLRVEEGAVINGDVIILGGNVFFAGQSGRDTKIVAGNVYVDGYLKGNTEITTQHLILADGIKIEGNLSYFSPEQVSVKESSVVGEVSYNRIETIRDNSFVKRMILNVVSFWILLRFISTLLLAFILVYVFRFFTQKTVTFATKRWGVSLGIGILFLTLVPIIAVVFSVSLIAISFSILMMLAYLFIIIVATGIAGIYTGVLIKRLVLNKKDYSVSFKSASLGVVTITLLKFVPLFGDMIIFAVSIISMGTIVNYLYTNIRFRDKIE